MARRGFVLCTTIVATLVTVSAAPPSFAQYPSKPVRMVIPLPPGSNMDTIGRVLAQGLTESLGQPVVVENKPGAEAAIAAEAVRDAAPDGHTIGMLSMSLAFTPLINKNITFDPRRDFAPISMLGRMTFALSIAPTTPAKSLRELIDYGHAHPGKLNHGSMSTVDTLLAHPLLQATGISMTRVDYKGPAQLLQDLSAGRIDVATIALGAQLELAKTGRIRMLAVFGMNRDPQVPDVPTMAEAGVPEATFDGFWLAMFGPAKMPNDRVDRVEREIGQVLRRPDVHQKFMSLSVRPESSTPEALGAQLAADVDKWGKVVRESGIVR